MLLSCQNITMEYVTGVVLDHVSFHMEEHDRLAIIGINGAGKSTLLKIITGNLAPTEGIVTLAKGKTFGYLSQDASVDTDKTIYEELLSVLQPILDMEQLLRDMEAQMQSLDSDALSAHMERYQSLSHSFELANGHTYMSELNGVLKGLGFDGEMQNQKISTLSGGQKTRVALGKLLLSAPDLIILDEPTNHLDMSSIAWLENYLQNYKGSVILVSHDRYFLDKITTRVLELENGKATTFIGNYTDFAAKKELLRNAQIAAYLNQQREIKHQEAVIEKLKSFNREKSIRRAESREKALEKIEVLDKPTEIHAQMNLTLTPHMQSGNDVLSIESLSKAYGSNLLFADVNLEIKRGEHVAIIGDNGTGKTTLLKIINQFETADSGCFTLGTNVEIGYYDQEHQVLHYDKTVYDEIADAYPYLTVTEIRSTLAAFLFTGDDVFKKIESLSGGERGRLSLAKLMLSDCNFLILDEPTNHLDIVSKEILENAINNYTGTVLYVSHDRYFINKTASRILELKQRQFLNYIGNYDYYLEKQADVYAANAILSCTVSSPVSIRTVPPETGTDTLASTQSSGSKDWKTQKEEQARLRKKENDLKKCEAEIEKLENQIAVQNKLLEDPANAANSVKLQEITALLEELQTKLDAAYELWETLAE